MRDEGGWETERGEKVDGRKICPEQEDRMKGINKRKEKSRSQSLTWSWSTAETKSQGRGRRSSVEETMRFWFGRVWSRGGALFTTSILEYTYLLCTSIHYLRDSQCNCLSSLNLV